MMTPVRLLLLITALVAPCLASAYIPESDPAPVSAATRTRLAHTACASTFGVEADTMRTWRHRWDRQSQSIFGSVVCHADSSFRGMPARYRVACELQRTKWKCDGWSRELLVPTAVGTVVVVPNSVQVQQAVDAVRELATVEYFETEDLGRIAIRDSVPEGCWLTVEHSYKAIRVQCGPTLVWMSRDGSPDGGMRIDSASWVVP